MTTRSRTIVAWALGATGPAAIATSVTLSLGLGSWDPQDTGLVIPLAIGTVAMSIIGALVASRTGNPIGWLLLAIPATLWVAQVAQDLADYALPRGASYGAFAYWLASWPFFASMLLLVAIFYLFPTGHVASHRWRWPWRIYVAASIVTIVGFAVLPYRTDVDTGAVVTNPVGIDALEGFLSVLLAVAGFSLLASGFLAFVSLAMRYRRGEAEERQQLRWLFAVGAAAAVAVALGITFGMLGDRYGGAYATIGEVLLVVLAALLGVGIPAATGVAIFRYHLYDLNLVIRRTVVYAVLAAFITVVYVGIVVLFGAVVTDPDSLLPSILATTIVAALFQPVRGRATRLANRLAFGRRAEPYEVLSTFSDRVGGTYAAEDVLPRLARVIAEGTGAQGVEIWLRRDGGQRRVASWPLGAETLTMPDHSVQIVHRETVLGEIRVRKPSSEPLTETEEKLLADLASQAGVVVRNVGLTSELQAKVDELSRRAEELRASRARIVAAHDAERRRLERNIHDGAQQHLVALAVKLRLARALAANAPEQAAAMLRELGQQTELARATLLDLASGIYPATLEERGIAAALEEQARTAGTRAEIEANEIGRLPIETEAAVYFVCLEAMQNAQKYAQADHVRVRLGHEDGHLAFEVHDDGVGFDETAVSGSGLQNMRDRLAALGGEVEIASTLGRGTVVRGHVPVRQEVLA